MKKQIVFTLVLGFLFSTTGMAQNSRLVHRSRNVALMHGKMLASILDEEQLKKWNDIRIDYQKERNNLQAELKNTRLELHQLMNSQRLPDENEVNKKLEQISNLSQKMMQNAYTQQLELRKIMTDEQWQKIQNLKKERWEQRPGRRGHCSQ